MRLPPPVLIVGRPIEELRRYDRNLADYVDTHNFLCKHVQKHLPGRIRHMRGRRIIRRVLKSLHERRDF